MTWPKSSLTSALVLLGQLCSVSLVWGGDIALQLGEELAALGSYDQAITEYKRFMCFSADQGAKSEACLQIAYACRAEEKWDEAVAAFRASLALAPNDSMRHERRLQSAVTLIAAGRHTAAEFALLRVYAFADVPALKCRAGFFLGVASLYKGKWEAARDYLADYFSDNPAVRQDIVDSLLAPPNRPRQRSPMVAKWLSTFLPGSGQLYAGSLRHGLNSLGVNLGTGYLSGDALADRRYPDALLAYLPLFWRYYKGSRYHAVRICRARNVKIDREYSALVLQALDDALK